MKHTINVELRRVETALARKKSRANAGFSWTGTLLGKPSVTLPVKLKMAEIILKLRQNEMRLRRKFGLLVILGWKKQWQKYADTPDASQDLFARQQINIMKVGNGDGHTAEQRRRNSNARRGNIVNTINFDGAILIDPHGNILHSGTMIEGLRPRATAHTMRSRERARQGNATDLSSQFGFKRKVHMRHITAITSSYTFRGTTVFTVSEETNDFHIFENGKIAYSTVRGESARNAKRKK